VFFEIGVSPAMTFRRQCDMRFRVLVCFIVVLTQASFATAASRRETLSFGGRTRSYIVHLPPGYDGKMRLPVVLVFHGGGLGTATQAERSYGLSELADQKKFIAVFPDGIDHHWNDLRAASRLGAARQVDDVAFVAALIDHLAKEYKIDRKRIYATGISNGGIFTYTLAAKLADRIAAIAPVAGNLAEPVASSFAPSQPVSVIAFNGDVDPLVPYNGGAVTGRGDVGGRVLSTADTIALFVKACGCSSVSQQTLPARKPSDGTTVVREVHGGGRDGAEVILYTIKGGGHTWPGHPGMMFYGAIAGHTTKTIDATALMWEFFERRSKP
jgi:polyhydroxybutyrate depolymerase